MLFYPEQQYTTSIFLWSCKFRLNKDATIPVTTKNAKYYDSNTPLIEAANDAFYTTPLESF